MTTPRRMASPSGASARRMLGMRNNRAAGAERQK